MSLALRSFFWGDWPTPPTPQLPGETRTHGGGRSQDVPVPPDFWDVREAYLKSLFETPPQPDVTADNAAAIAEWEARKQQIEQLADERFRAVAALRLASNLSEMKAKGAQIAELTSKIATLTHKQAFQNFMKH